MNPNNIFLSSTNVETLPEEEGLHTPGGRQESIPELRQMALRVDWLCVFCAPGFILMDVI